MSQKYISPLVRFQQSQCCFPRIRSYPFRIATGFLPFFGYVFAFSRSYIRSFCATDNVSVVYVFEAMEYICFIPLAIFSFLLNRVQFGHSSINVLKICRSVPPFFTKLRKIIFTRKVLSAYHIHVFLM